jgi:hypothetical protein
MRRDVIAENKSEVAMGLVKPHNSKLKIDMNLRHSSDIFGEKGIQVWIDGKAESFDPQDILDPKYFLDPNKIIYPEKFYHFEEFLDIFHDFISSKSNMVNNVHTLKEKAGDMKSLVTAYMETDDEWRKANEHYKANKSFEYRIPFFIAEGITYLNQVIIPQVFND